ncbi:MBL fold metallo-hydrolase [Halobacillus karajensis]|uniref:Hydroxyacylglutathione hydrolase n=1 Tax=Halobacillus karajensis TaxID=195088 RepID=A0A024P672_9BACI|nr:MBL fold metallo-hydrolase [Halobacillus karajensis]CDQ17852.1 hydroxyacylglutathione hydrolase [Halobacillus karajensis]CDQ24258.1 hydroxyacylglutathione hydrolase [Halobacillus karajensis]CDQ29493.1 hydroxyacylglutathione hydrolase [Halobacillus karajensis]
MKILKDTIKQLTLPTPYAVGDVHVYLLIGHRLTLVDAGVKTEDCWNAFVEQLKGLGYRPEDIDQVILTHHHPDHTGLVERLPNVDTIAGHVKLKPWLERDEEYFDRYESFFQNIYKESGVPDRYLPLLKGIRKTLKWTSKGKLTHALSEGDRLPGHEEWITIETPGHAQSHLSFLREEDGAFIGGDHLLSHISSNPLLEPPYQAGAPRPRPLLQYRHSMEKLLGRTITTVYPGHGKIFNHAHMLIPDRLKKQEQRANKVLAMFNEGALRAYDVCKRLFPKHIENQFGLTMSETIGQLDYLEKIGELTVSYEDGEKLYTIK